jgi:hypothetical protein
VPSKTSAAGANPTSLATEYQVSLKGDSISGNNQVYTTNGTGAATAKPLADFAQVAAANTFTAQNSFSNYSPTVPTKSTDAANSPTIIATEAQVFKKIDKLTSNSVVYTNNGAGTLTGETLDSFVRTSGAQSIADVKTFTSQPVIPAKTTLPATPVSTAIATEAQVGTRLPYIDAANIVYTNNGTKVPSSMQIGAFAQVGVANDFT